MNSAYENIKVVDCLDISREGVEAWEAAVARYEERIDRVEARITAHLRDQLGTARNANEMFRIFSRFNALFVRPHIRGAIREYQTQLINKVKEDIEALHDKFKVIFNYYLKITLRYYSKLIFLDSISSKQSLFFELSTRHPTNSGFYFMGKTN